LESWRDAICAYASQVSMLFETDEGMRVKIRQYWSENKGMRLWSFG